MLLDESGGSIWVSKVGDSPSLHRVYLGSTIISLCDIVNNILNSASVNLNGYLIFDGKIGDTECIDVTKSSTKGVVLLAIPFF